jgi:hypothetical protein
MAKYEDVYRKAMANYDKSMIDQQAAFQKATLEGDEYEQTRASMELAALRVQRNEYHRMASEHAQSLRPSRQSPAGMEDYHHSDQALAAHYGMDSKRYDAATGWTADDRVSKEERIRTFLQNERRYQYLRASGYRDEFDAQGKR